MTYPDKFGICASNIYTNHVMPYYSYFGSLVVDWNVIYPQEQYMISPVACESSKTYTPCQEVMQFWDFSELCVGYPSFSISWEAMESQDIHAVLQEYDYAVKNTQSRVWLTIYNMELGNWQYTSGVMEEPQIQRWEGDTALGVTLNFGRIGFHLNAPTNDYPAAHFYDKHALIEKDFFGYFLFNNEDFRTSDWNY